MERYLSRKVKIQKKYKGKDKDPHKEISNNRYFLLFV